MHNLKPMGVFDLVHVLFTTANLRFSRLVYNVCISWRGKRGLQNGRKPNVFNALYLVKFVRLINIQQLFTIAFIRGSVLAASSSRCPSYMFKVPINFLTRFTHSHPSGGKTSHANGCIVRQDFKKQNIVANLGTIPILNH